jgi:hypothetical protein
MATDDRGRLENNNNSIDDILRTVNMSTASFAENKNIKSISVNAPINPFNSNAIDFYSNYTSGQYEMGWFRNYDHYLHHSSSNFTSIPSLNTHAQIGGTNVSMNTLGWNQRSYLLSNHPQIDSSGDVAWTTGSIFTYHYRGVNNSGLEAKVTSYGLGGAATTYNGNIDTQVMSTSIRNMGVAPVERGFLTSSRSVVIYRNAADGEDTYARVINVDSSGNITFENALEISTAYNQIFNKSINVGNNRVLMASHRGGNDINMFDFKYNGTNNYSFGETTVASTQHNCFPTLAYVNDDLVVFFYSRRTGTTFDRYINAKLYTVSDVNNPVLESTATEYDYGSERIGQAPDCAVGRGPDNRDTFGIYVFNHTSDYKGRAVPFKVTHNPDFVGASSVQILPSGTSVLAQTNASRRPDVANAYRSTVHVTPLGTDPTNSTKFLFFCITSPGYGWIVRQDISTGALSTVIEDELQAITSSNCFRRADFHYFGVPGNGSRGMVAGGQEFAKVAGIIAGEYGPVSGDMYLGSAALLFG